MSALIALLAVVLLVVLYAAWGRDWLKSKPWAAKFFDVIEPIEIFLFKKSGTILFARLKIFVGLVLTLLTQLGTIDLTPLKPLLPEEYHGWFMFAVNMLPLAITLMGMIDEKLRNATTKPLELVAIPEAKPLPPEVKVAVEAASAARKEAVATVKENKVV